MQYVFSGNNSVGEFDSIDSNSEICLGFASDPALNVFSHKHRGSKYGSTTETLLDNLDLLQLPQGDDASIVLHLVQGIVPLDGATASYAVQRNKDELASACWKYLSKYIGEIEKGYTRPPFNRSLYAFYYASVQEASTLFPAEDQVSERNNYLIENYHKALGAVLDSGGIEDYSSPYHFIDLLPKTISTSLQEEIIANEQLRFIQQDYQRSERFEVDLPLKGLLGDEQNDTRYHRTSFLALSNPKSALFKFYARNPMRYPGEPEEQTFPCTYVHNARNKGRSSEHVISVPPTVDYNLKGLSNLIEKIEDHARERLGENPRSKDQPRPGYAYDDPWYDERHGDGYSILDNPRDGSRLERDDVLEAMWFFGSPLKNVKAEHVTTSVIIPFWPDDLEMFIGEQLKNADKWRPWKYEEKYVREFLPYMEKIFLETDQSDKRLMAFQAIDLPKLNVDPDHVLDEGPTVDVVRKIMLDSSNQILQASDISLRCFAFEYGLCFLELEIEYKEKDASIFDIQWLEHNVTLTPVETLLGNSINWKDLRVLLPHRHFACTSMTQFYFESGFLRDGRSIGGGIQMMVSDVEPIFKNLPLNKSIITGQTVVDETSKRYYFCSSTSILNFDDSASYKEHRRAHVAASAIFNMVLAQRFILSESRVDIINAEQQYQNKKQHLTISSWLFSWLKRENQKQLVDVSRVRERIQHMTTSAWFNVVSNLDSIQSVFDKLREQMRIADFYDEVKDRTTDLDEFIAKKQSDVQSRVFDIFTFVMSPLNFVIGFVGGLGLASFSGTENPVPFFDVKDDLHVFIIYFIIWSLVFGIVWLVYKYKSAKE